MASSSLVYPQLVGTMPLRICPWSDGTDQCSPQVWQRKWLVLRLRGCSHLECRWKGRYSHLGAGLMPAPKTSYPWLESGGCMLPGGPRGTDPESRLFTLPFGLWSSDLEVTMFSQVHLLLLLRGDVDMQAMLNLPRWSAYSLGLTLTQEKPQC